MNKKQKEEQRRKATERYSKKVEIPICVILETIFSGDNQDVETLSRYARDYGFVDFKTGKRYGKYGSYIVQKDYEKQSFYLCLDEEERKKYDYENHLLDKIERLNNIINKAIHFINLNQDSKKLTLNYDDLKKLRGILNNDDYYLTLFEEQLKELKGE